MIFDYLKYLIEKDYHLIIVYIIIGFFVYEILKKILLNHTKKLQKKRQKTMQKLIQNIIKYIIIIIVAVAILKIFGINVTSIVAGLGIASIVLSFALKDIMQDILAGIFIILEDQFDVGDYVEINGFSGTIIDLGLKSTKIRNFENKIKIISNRLINEVTNHSKENPSFFIDITIPYQLDNKEADKIIQNIINRIEKEITTIKDKVDLWGLNKLESHQISYRMLITVAIDTQWTAKRQVNRIIKEEFDKAKINVPVNKIEVKNG